MNINKLNILILILAISFVDSKAQFDFFESKATIGGYGEMHYNYKNDNGVTKNTLDFHRFVVFVGYSFSEKWSFKSEIEIEHNYVSDGEGELSLEQAYLDYHFRNYLGFQAGVILVSAGLINENHEPTQFFGVERPNYAKYIIPTTWFGNGFAMYGNYNGFEYKLNFMEGLLGDKFSLNNAIRNGRQKGFESDASAMLYNLKIDYTDILGLKIGGSATYNNSISDSLSIPFTLFAMDETASKPPSDAAGKPASSTSTPSFFIWVANRSFSAVFMLAPGDCSPSRRVVSKIMTLSLMFLLLMMLK